MMNLHFLLRFRFLTSEFFGVVLVQSNKVMINGRYELRYGDGSVVDVIISFSFSLFFVSDQYHGVWGGQ